MKKRYFILIFFIFLAINNLVAQSNKLSDSINQKKLSGEAISNKSKDVMVNTPAGTRLKSKGHHIDSKHHLNIKNGHITQIIETKTGKVSEEFDEGNSKKKTITKISNDNSKSDSSGWITYAYWSNNNVFPVSYFSTNWIVPSPPTTFSDQTIFLFNGLTSFDSSEYILQPVLQWGKSDIGGGNYWAIANWCVGDSNYFYDTLYEVSPGTNLQGVMKLTSSSGDKYNYNSSFAGYSFSTLQVNNLFNPDWASETLEVYGIKQCSDYPADEKVRMSEIMLEIKDTTYPLLYWSPIDEATECGQHTIVVTNGSYNGVVDIYFHDSLSSVLNIPPVDEINIYPNPATDKLTIETNFNTEQRLEIVNLIGQTVYTTYYINKKATVNISAFPRGVYILKLYTDKKTVVKEFIKQ